MKIFLIFLNIFILSSCAELTRTKDELTQNAQVYAEDALETLEIARNFNSQNNAVNQRSLAQIVFPKAVKGSFIFGGNYAEGYLIENGQKFSLQGTASYAKSGQSVTDIFGQISDGQSLITIIFNQSGYLAGISFEGTYISRKK